MEAIRVCYEIGKSFSIIMCRLRVVRDLRTGLLPWGGSVLVVGLYGVCIVTPL